MAKRDDVDEEGNKHPNQGIEDAVEREVENAGIRAMRDGDAQKGNAGDVGQRAFSHEVRQKNQRGNGKEFFQVASFIKNSGKLVFLDRFGNVHQGQDAKRDKKIFQNGQTEDAQFADDEEDNHAGESTDQRADSAVHANAEGAFDFRLQADDRGNTGIKRYSRPDIEEFIDQATDEDGKCRLHEQFSHRLNGVVAMANKTPLSF